MSTTEGPTDLETKFNFTPHMRQHIHRHHSDSHCTPSAKMIIFYVFGMLITSLTGNIKIYSQVITAQDRLNMMEEADKKKNKLIEQCMARKDEMQKLSQKHLRGQKYSLLESDAQQQATYILRRAFEIKQEQEDEVSSHYIITIYN